MFSPRLFGDASKFYVDIDVKTTLIGVRTDPYRRISMRKRQNIKRIRSISISFIRDMRVMVQRPSI